MDTSIWLCNETICMQATKPQHTPQTQEQAVKRRCFVVKQVSALETEK